MNMTCQDIDKIKDILKSGDYDLACQLWIGGNDRTSNLEELACIIINTGIYEFEEKVSNRTVILNDHIRVKINVSGPSMKSIRHITVFYKGVKVWGMLDNTYENRDVLFAATTIALNYMIYDEFKSSRLDCGWFISSIVIKGLPNQSEFI